MFLPKKFHQYAAALIARLWKPPPGRQSSIPAPVFAKALRREPGGGSSSLPDICRPITPEYTEEVCSLGLDELRAALGLTFEELAELSTEDFYVVAIDAMPHRFVDWLAERDADAVPLQKAA